MRTLLAALLIGALAACATTTYATPEAVLWREEVAEPNAEAIQAQPVVARRQGHLTLLPISPTGAVVGTDYRYEMPHCGIGSPIDVDGTFWDPANLPEDPVQFDGAVGTFRLTTPNTATFTDSMGRVLHLLRHSGAKEFRYCA